MTKLLILSVFLSIVFSSCGTFDKSSRANRKLKRAIELNPKLAVADTTPIKLSNIITSFDCDSLEFQLGKKDTLIFEFEKQYETTKGEKKKVPAKIKVSRDPVDSTKLKVDIDTGPIKREPVYVPIKPTLFDSAKKYWYTLVFAFLFGYISSLILHRRRHPP
jgi:hypothetical protein